MSSLGGCGGALRQRRPAKSSPSRHRLRQPRRLPQPQHKNLGGTAMFETATKMIEKQLPAGDHPDWLAPVITLVVAWFIFMMIREFWCWFWKTSEIADQ